MSLDEYFGDWVETFDLTQLNRTVNCLNILYASNPVVPKYEDIFKAFTLCSKKDCRVVFLGHPIHKKVLQQEYYLAILKIPRTYHHP